MKKTLVLKKYANRRLYDTERSLYVTLQELAETIREGRRVEVHDAQTKEDVTAFILTQIVLEEAKSKNTLLPVPVLHLIIQFGNNILGEFFEIYLQQIIQAYLSQKAVFEQHFKQWISSGMNWSGEPLCKKLFHTADLSTQLFRQFPGKSTHFDLIDRWASFFRRLWNLPAR